MNAALFPSQSSSSRIDERLFPAPLVSRGDVRDHGAPALAYASAKLLTRDEARRISPNIAKLPELLRVKNAPAAMRDRG